jgi:hypothetical protein
VFNHKTSDTITRQINDYAQIAVDSHNNVNASFTQKDEGEKGQSLMIEGEPLPKMNWAQVRDKDANLDEGKVIFEDNYEKNDKVQVNRILEAAI